MLRDICAKSNYAHLIAVISPVEELWFSRGCCLWGCLGIVLFTLRWFDKVTKPRLDFKALPLLRETYLRICHSDRTVRTTPSSLILNRVEKSVLLEENSELSTNTYTLLKQTDTQTIIHLQHRLSTMGVLQLNMKYEITSMVRFRHYKSKVFLNRFFCYYSIWCIWHEWEFF